MTILNALLLSVSEKSDTIIAKNAEILDLFHTATNEYDVRLADTICSHLALPLAIIGGAIVMCFLIVCSFKYYVKKLETRKRTDATMTKAQVTELIESHMVAKEADIEKIMSLISEAEKLKGCRANITLSAGGNKITITPAENANPDNKKS